MNVQTLKLEVWGQFACFTQPEFKAERCTYDVITPSAARGIYSAIHWKPAFNWVIDRIHVLSPIRHVNFRKNEVNHKISCTFSEAESNDTTGLGVNINEHRQQRAMRCLQNVKYGLEAHIDLIGNEDRNIVKHTEIFKRRASKGQHFQHPYFGMREFLVSYKFVPSDQDFSESKLIEKNRDFGIMLYDLNYETDHSAIPYHAKMVNGIIDVQAGLNF